MLFTSTDAYNASIPKNDFIRRLTGRKVSIHNLDFEVIEKDNKLKIIPHADNVTEIKTLPITHIDVKEDGSKTKVVVTSKIRRIDAGGPLLVMIFCSFMFLVSLVLFYVDRERMINYTLLGIASTVLVMFVVRMQMGYFDYVRKIRAYIRETTLSN